MSAISNIIVYIHEVDDFLNDAENLLGEIISCPAYMNHDNVLIGREVNRNTHDRFHDLNEETSLPQKLSKER